MQTRNLSHTHTGEILQVRASPQLHLSVWCLPLLNGQWSWHTPVEGRGVTTEVARQDKQALTAAACAVSLPHTGQAGLVAKLFYDHWTHRKRFIGLQHASNKRSYNLGAHKVKWPSITRVKLNTLTHLVVVVFFPMRGKISMGLGTSPEQEHLWYSGPLLSPFTTSGIKGKAESKTLRKCLLIPQMKHPPPFSSWLASRLGQQQHSSFERGFLWASVCLEWSQAVKMLPAP